jgi:hypothetical protein
MDSYIQLTIDGVDGKTAPLFMAFLANDNYDFSCHSEREDEKETTIQFIIRYYRNNEEDDERIEYLHKVLHALTTEVVPLMNEKDLKKLFGA